MKSTLYVGYKQQIEQYEPLEIGASVEMEHDPESKDVNDVLTAMVISRLEAQSALIAGKVAAIKKKVIEELSDEVEGDDEW